MTRCRNTTARNKSTQQREVGTIQNTLCRFNGKVKEKPTRRLPVTKELIAEEKGGGSGKRAARSRIMKLNERNGGKGMRWKRIEEIWGKEAEIKKGKKEE